MDGMHHKTKVSEIQDYRNMLLKIRIKSIRVYSVIFGSIVFMFFWVGDPTEECVSASPAAIMKFLCPIIQCNPVDTLNKAFGNIAQTYGIALGLLAAFTLYKRGKLSEKLDKTINDSLKLREKYDGHAFRKREDKIINEYERIKTNLTTEDKDRLDHYVEWLKTYAKHREEIKCRLNWFICIHAIPLILYILLLFFHKTEFPQMINALILIGALVFLLFSFYLTYHIVKTLKE